jgi:replication-associated recombination protein RarA
MEKLDYYLEHKQIPNLLFHGPSGSGKKTILQGFLKQLYPDKEIMEQQVMYVNCAYGKGIKFIREEVKFFSKMNTHSLFKSVVLLNAEKLTPDSQFALRRCIELFNYNTRFFMVTIDKYKLIRPILSRFSEIYISNPINLHTLQTFDFQDYDTKQRASFDAIMSKASKDTIQEVSHELYEHGHSALDIQQWVSEKPDSLEKYNWLITFSKIKGECSHEELLIYLSLSLYFHSMTITFFI